LIEKLFQDQQREHGEQEHVALGKNTYKS